MSSIDQVGDEAMRIVRTVSNSVAFPPYWMHESNHVNTFVNGLHGTRLEVLGQELGGPGARADIAAEFVTDDGVRVPVCIEVFKGQTLQGVTRFCLGLRARRRFPIVIVVVLLADTVRSVEKRQTLEGHINRSLDLEITERTRAFYGASVFVYI